MIITTHQNKRYGLTEFTVQNERFAALDVETTCEPLMRGETQIGEVYSFEARLPCDFKVNVSWAERLGRQLPRQAIVKVIAGTEYDRVMVSYVRNDGAQLPHVIDQLYAAAMGPT